MKRLMAAWILSVTLCGLAAAQSPAPIVFFVAPDGNDANPGTKDQPFATLQRAQAAVRVQIADGLQADVTVHVAPGIYELPETLVFGPEDSGTEQHAIRYQAAPKGDVVLSGGRRITGWQRGEGPLWTAKVPGVAEGKWYFRNLFVGDRRAVRARTPNVDEEPNCTQLTGVEFSPDRAYFAVRVAPSLLGPWKNPGDVEVMIVGNWAINRKRAERIEPDTNTVVLAPPHQHGPRYIFPSPKRWSSFENARELLDQPGEWYLDRGTGTLSYWPRPDEDMTKTEIFAPKLHQLVVVEGTPDRPVRNLHFKGFCFAHTDWELPAQGYMGIQACHYGRSSEPGRRWRRIPAAVRFTCAEDCRVEDGRITQLGGSGIELADRTKNCLLEGNHVFDVSANGIMVGGPKLEDAVPVGNQVRNNHVHACGQEFFGAIGIWVGFARGTVVAHNQVHDLPYSGISVGWEWNDSPTPCRENLIEYNHVYDVMKRLCDGGCIYTLGFQPGTVIRGNHLHDVHRSPMAQGAPNNGMFIDQGSKGYLFECNVIYNTSAQHVRFNQCQRDWHEWRDNHFGEASEVKQSGRAIIEKAGLEKS